MTSINPNNNSNEIRQYAETIFAKLDAKDGKDDSISKSIWEQFIGGKVEEQEIGNGSKSQIKVRITKENAINSIVSYIKKFGLGKKEQINNIVDNIKSSQAQSTSEKQCSSSYATDAEHLYVRFKNTVETMENKYPEIVNDRKEYIKAKTVLDNVRQALGIAAFLDSETNQVKLDLDNPEDCEKVRQYYNQVIATYRSMGRNDIAKRYIEALKQFESALSTISALKQKYADAKDPSFDDYAIAKGYMNAYQDLTSKYSKSSRMGETHQN